MTTTKFEEGMTMLRARLAYICPECKQAVAIPEWARHRAAEGAEAFKRAEAANDPSRWLR